VYTDGETQRAQIMILIKDREDTPQGFPLHTLARLVCAAGHCRDSDVWSVTRARGYGERICALEDRLRTAQFVSVTAKEILEMVSDPDEWFYDLDCRAHHEMRFGLIDSSALFLDAPDDITNSVEGHFSLVTRR
jgi:hypothetical protein